MGAPWTKRQSVIPCSTRNPSRLSQSPSIEIRTSREIRVIASCTSTRPNFAFLYPVYPKQVTSIHFRTESMPAIVGSAFFAAFVPIRISSRGRRHSARKPGRSGVLDRLGREVVLHDDRRVERGEVDLIDPFVHPRDGLEHHPAPVRCPERRDGLSPARRRPSATAPRSPGRAPRRPQRTR